MMVSSFVAGIPFDLTHCIGNFVVCLVLFKPLNMLFTRIFAKLPGRAAKPQEESA